MKKLLLFLLFIVIIYLLFWGLMYLGAAGQKNSLPYKSWSSREEMIERLSVNGY
jgi:hypothetical protein